MRLALLGDPVGHSRSPAIFRAAFGAVSLDGVYEARRVGPAGFDRAVAEIAAGALHGANVTMPHKVRAAAACDRAAEEVRRCGAANTLAGRDGVVAAWNTDVTALRRLGGDLAPGAPVLVLGAGGAAAAAVVAFEGRPTRVAARRPGAAAELADVCDVPFAPHPWGEALGGAVVVNATPLGRSGERLPAAVLGDAAGLIDLAYGETATPAVAEALRRGVPVVDGLAVLVAQAADAFEVWTGQPAPVEAMEVAARA